MGGTSTVWFLVYHFTNHVGFQESGKLKYPEVPRKLNSHNYFYDFASGLSVQATLVEWRLRAVSYFSLTAWFIIVCS